MPNNDVYLKVALFRCCCMLNSNYILWHLTIKFEDLPSAAQMTLKKPLNATMRVGLKKLCIHVAMLHPGHTPTMPSQQPPLIQSPTSAPSPHTHTHTHSHTPTCAQPRHPSPHHPQTSPLSLFQGAHGKPPESAGLRRTWAWPNSFPWLWTWDHPLLIFLSYPFLFVAFPFFPSFHPR